MNRQSANLVDTVRVNSPLRAVRQPSRMGSSSVRRSKRLGLGIWPALVVMYASLLPEDAHIQIGDFRLFAYRLALFFVLPFTLGAILKARIKLGLADAAVLFAALWISLAMCLRHGLETGLERGGVLTFDLLSAYWIGRCYLRTPVSFHRALVWMVPGLVVVAGAMLIESVRGSLIVRPTFAAIFGTELLQSQAIVTEQRLGLTRAYGPFPHPILGGLYMTAFIPLFALGLRSLRMKTIGLTAACFGLFALSSAAFISFFLCWALITYDKIQRTIRDLSWPPFLLAIAVLAVVLHFTSQSGIFSIIIRYLAIDPSTGYYRVLIWDYGLQNIQQNPWFGLGFDEWFRPAWMRGSSIDAHWLALAIQSGVPASMSLLAATVLVVFQTSHAASLARAKAVRNLSVGLAICLVVHTITMFSVTLWAGPLSWFHVLLGSAAGLSRVQRARVAREVTPTTEVVAAPGGRSGSAPYVQRSRL